MQILRCHLYEETPGCEAVLQQLRVIALLQMGWGDMRCQRSGSTRVCEQESPCGRYAPPLERLE